MTVTSGAGHRADQCREARCGRPSGVDGAGGTGPGRHHGRGDRWAALGVGGSKAYELAKTGEFPVRVVRIGRRYVVPVAAILQLLDIE